MMFCLIGKHACHVVGKRKGRQFIGFPPPKGSFKFNVDGTTKGKPGPFKYCRCPFVRGKIFSKNVGVKRFEQGSNFGHSRILWIFAGSFQGSLIVESDSSVTTLPKHESFSSYIMRLECHHIFFRCTFLVLLDQQIQWWMLWRSTRVDHSFIWPHFAVVFGTRALYVYKPFSS